MELITRCSYCRRYEWPDGTWREEAPGEVIEGYYGNIDDSICPDCKKKVMENI